MTESKKPATIVSSAVTPVETDPYLKDRMPEKFNLRKAIHNPDKGTYFGRTPSSWAKITLFYAIFYVVLAALCAICTWGLLLSCPEDQPKWKLAESRIGTSPGLGFRPISSQLKDGALIKYQASNASEVARWTKQMDKFFDTYRNADKTHQEQCSFSTSAHSNNFCAVDLTQFGPCGPEAGYGYDKAQPCIFLKLNRIYNWVPEYLDANALPEEMPADLKAHIQSKPAAEQKQVWLSCKAENNADNETIGQIEMFPSQGFPGYFYPYRNQPGYGSPLIAVRFKNPKRSRLVNIECRAWAKNIHYEKHISDRQGSVHIELLVD